MIDPRHLSLTQWTDAVALTLSSLAPIPTLQGEDWEPWALAVIQAPAITRFSPPDPRHMPDWHAWAERFVQCVPL